jgi:hypothetical protein
MNAPFSLTGILAFSISRREIFFVRVHIFPAMIELSLKITVAILFKLG